MNAACPLCGGPIRGPEALCLECLKRVALRETAEVEESDGTAANDLLPETTQRKSFKTNLSAADDSPVGERWGDYELLEPIGRGAMGTVFKARHLQLNRLVALKLISHGRRASQSERKRFLREAEAVARLQHPHIVTLYEAGEADGQPFLAMEFVPGKTLAETIGEKPLPPRQAADCVRKIAEAVHYAHEHGVLHRDLKPSNVAQDQNGEPRVMDFGLARLVEQDSEITLTGMAIGSPSYMAPEQAAGKVREVSAASDVYALGAILYETLTARPPFQAESSVETMRQVVEKDAVSPRLLNASVPRDLETICLKCLEKEPQRRYRTAQELAEDLGRFVRDEPINAHPVSASEKAWRWCRRNRALASTGAAVVLLVLAVTVGSPVALFRINRERNQAVAARKLEAASRVRAESAERETQQQLYTALLEQARATVRSGELGQRIKALDALRRAAAISNSPALRGVALVALGLPDLRFERELPYGRNYTLRHPDPSFERIALCRDRGPIEIRATSDLRLLATLPASTNLPVYVAEWSPDGRFLAVKRDYGSTGTRSDKEIWELSAPAISTRSHEVSNETQALAARAQRLLLLRDVDYDVMAFHPHLSRLLVADNKAVILWDLEQGTEVNRILINGRPHYAQFAPDGERFAVAYNYRPSAASIISIHQVADGQLLASNVFANVVARFGWHPSGGWIAAPENDGGVHRMDAQTGQTRLLGRHKAEAMRMHFSPDGAYFMSGGWDREIICWDGRTLQRAFTASLNGYVGRFRADGRAYALETETGVKLLAFERASGRREFTEELGARLGQAAFSPDGRWLAVVGTERLGVWDLQSDGPAALGTNAAFLRVSFAANGELFADRYGGCFRWRASPGTNASSPPKLSPLELAMPKHFFSLSVISNRVVLNCHRGTAVVGQDELGIEPRDWQPTIEGNNGVSPDGRWLAVFRAQTPQLFVYRLPEFERVAILTNAANVARFQFSPAGDELAVSCRNNVEFWSTTTWQRIRSLTNFNAQFYSPDGRTLWLSQEPRTGGLHDARTLEPLLPTPPNTIPLAISPDGRRLAVSVDARRLQVWDLAEVRRQLAELGLDWKE